MLRCLGTLEKHTCFDGRLNRCVLLFLRLALQIGVVPQLLSNKAAILWLACRSCFGQLHIDRGSEESGCCSHKVFFGLAVIEG